MPLVKQKNNALPAAEKSQIHYDVYIYHRPANTNKQIQDWERKSSTGDVRRALLKAKSLHESEKYQRVEVKKRKLDSKSECVGSSILKTYEADTGYESSLWILLSVALVLGGLAGFILYLA